MIKSALPIALAATALLGLAACETTQQATAEETIQWNTPAQPPAASQAQPVTPPPPGPAAAPQPPAGAVTGPQCREYQTTIVIGGKPQQAFGRACRQPDGTWKDSGVRSDKPTVAGAPVEQSFPYGWYGYSYPDGPRYGPGGMSVGVGAGSRGGYMGYGVGF